MGDLYSSDFEKYLSHTNEKAILRDVLLNYISDWGVGSVLDIGAGNGDLSVPLSENVGEYVAVEPKPNFVSMLKRKNINVIDKMFPCEVGGSYDLILCSHSVPYEKEDFEPFLQEAWKRVNDGGHLVMITYAGSKDDWNTLLERLEIDPFEDHIGRYLKRKQFLESLGFTDVRMVRTCLECDNVYDMFEALSFVAGGGIAEKKKPFLDKRNEVEKILKEEYCYDERFVFPFDHYFLIVRK